MVARCRHLQAPGPLQCTHMVIQACHMLDSQPWQLALPANMDHCLHSDLLCQRQTQAVRTWPAAAVRGQHGPVALHQAVAAARGKSPPASRLSRITSGLTYYDGIPFYQRRGPLNLWPAPRLLARGANCGRQHVQLLCNGNEMLPKRLGWPDYLLINLLHTRGAPAAGMGAGLAAGTRAWRARAWRGTRGAHPR